MAIVRVAERTGKGIRDAPRDAIIAESSEGKKGKGFGIHRALDSAGAVIGAVIAFVFLIIFRPQTAGAELLDVLKITFLFAAILAFFALIPLIFVKSKEGEVKTKYKLGIKNLPRGYWYLVVITGLFAFGNFTYMFFVFQASGAFAAEWAFITPIALYIVFNVVYTGLSIPGGTLSDRIGKGNVLVMGYGFFGLTCLTFIFCTKLPLFIIGFILYGVSLAFVDGVQRAFISDIVVPEVRGTALGTFHMVTGLAALPTGIIAGILYDTSPIFTFLYGTVIGAVALILLIIFLQTNEVAKASS